MTDDDDPIDLTLRLPSVELEEEFRRLLVKAVRQAIEEHQGFRIDIHLEIRAVPPVGGR